MRIGVVLALVLAGATGPESVAQQPLLADLHGEWRGSGSLRRDLVSEMMQGRCRFTAGPGDSGGGVRIDGMCATAIGSATLGIAVAPCGGSCVRATGRSSAFPDVMTYDGTLDAPDLHLRSTNLVGVDGRFYRSEIHLTLHGRDRFGLVEDFVDAATGARAAVVGMDFVRKGE